MKKTAKPFQMHTVCQKFVHRAMNSRSKADKFLKSVIIAKNGAKNWGFS